MRKILTAFSRIFVGLLFIISGLIKLNDPVGFSYKLSEYFGETVLNMPFFIPYALAIAVAIVILEAMLGLMLLVGFRPRATIWSLLALIIFFTFLTFYSAYYNKVTDCGCFGDALKLTPWQSFTKDLILLVFILVLVINRRFVRPLGNASFRNAVVVIGLLGCCFMGYWVLNHLPLKDFRAYKVGTNIQKAMEIPDNAERSVVEMKFIYESDGIKKEYTDKELGNLPPNAKFVERIDKVISEGYKPPIHDFTMEKDGEDHKDALLSEPKLIVFVAYDLSKSSPDGLSKLEGVYQRAIAKGYKVVALTGSSAAEIVKAKKDFGLTFDFYFCDATALKTIERANPSIMALEKGTIVQKLHYNDSDLLNLN